jgi:hypothetical protein
MSKKDQRPVFNSEVLRKDRSQKYTIINKII